CTAEITVEIVATPRSYDYW
nr:immunoglobulin heavy chain junction region [Macaca mulatta]MOX60299.1 immunoglobulin heavy chain junction region [Macaca mulatta]MOX61574.1 immunoglobulin heavy chain junction region [Macaca mulatta]MOX63326.1 immunoglobulin heavy chain junction region [Macaca mulatta]MOX65771.1 immunoglobulin heavy chain junction region [Macaca mulatta]